MTFPFAVVCHRAGPHARDPLSVISGDFKSCASTTRLADFAKRVRVVHHGEYLPKAWPPSMIGVSVTKSETKKQFAEFSAEMLRLWAIGTDTMSMRSSYCGPCTQCSGGTIAQ